MTYEMIFGNYTSGLWNEQMVKIALDKGVITREQYDEILAAR